MGMQSRLSENCPSSCSSPTGSWRSVSTRCRNYSRPQKSVTSKSNSTSWQLSMWLPNLLATALWMLKDVGRHWSSSCGLLKMSGFRQMLISKYTAVWRTRTLTHPIAKNRRLMLSPLSLVPPETQLNSARKTFFIFVCNRQLDAHSNSLSKRRNQATTIRKQVKWTP